MVAASYTVRLSSNAVKDLQKLQRAELSTKAKQLVGIIAVNPYQNPPPYEKPVGRLSGEISRRINIQHRLVYTVLEDEGLIMVSSMWSHYEGER